MSISHAAIKTQCVIWENIDLPHPSKSIKSPVFYLDESSWYFEVKCFYKKLPTSTFVFGHTLKNCTEGGEEVFHFAMKLSSDLDSSNPPSNYVIIPYVETKDKYVCIAPNIKDTDLWRSSFTKIIGSDKDTVTILFSFSQHSLSSEQTFKETPLVMTKEDDSSGKESIQTLCLKGLSEDIGKLFNDVESADATLKCNDKCFFIHRKILAARSEVFSAMFKHNLSEKNIGMVDIDDLDLNILKQFLRYLYSEIELTSVDEALELYQAAEKYSVRSLKKIVRFLYSGQYVKGHRLRSSNFGG